MLPSYLYLGGIVNPGKHISLMLMLPNMQWYLFGGTHITREMCSGGHNPWGNTYHCNNGFHPAYGTAPYAWRRLLLIYWTPTYISELLLIYRSSYLYIGLLLIYRTPTYISKAPMCISDSYLYIGGSYIIIYIRLLFIYRRVLYIYRTPTYISEVSIYKSEAPTYYIRKLHTVMALWPIWPPIQIHMCFVMFISSNELHFSKAYHLNFLPVNHWILKCLSQGKPAALNCKWASWGVVPLLVTYATTIGVKTSAFGSGREMWTQPCHPLRITHLRVTLFHPAGMLEVHDLANPSLHVYHKIRILSSAPIFEISYQSGAYFQGVPIFMEFSFSMGALILILLHDSNIILSWKMLLQW